MNFTPFVVERYFAYCAIETVHAATPVGFKKIYVVEGNVQSSVLQTVIAGIIWQGNVKVFTMHNLLFHAVTKW